MEDRESSSGSDATESGGRTSSGQCRVLSLNDAATLLARSTSSQSSASASHDVQHFLTDLGRRLATRTVVLCRAVAEDGNGSPGTASSWVPSSSNTDDHHYILTTTTRSEENEQPQEAELLSDDLKDGANILLTGNGNSIKKAQHRPDDTKRVQSVDDISNMLRTGTIHRLRHRRHHHSRQAGDRKHIRASPFNRKYYWRRSRRTLDNCGGRHVDVERVAAIMEAFYCWDDEVARLTNQLRRSADEHLQMTSSTSQLRCRLMRRYDECRQNFIDKVFRTGHGLAISWPRQITDVMDRVDNAIYY